MVGCWQIKSIFSAVMAKGKKTVFLFCQTFYGMSLGKVLYCCMFKWCICRSNRRWKLPFNYIIVQYISTPVSKVFLYMVTDKQAKKLNQSQWQQAVFENEGARKMQNEWINK